MGIFSTHSTLPKQEEEVAAPASELQPQTPSTTYDSFVRPSGGFFGRALWDASSIFGTFAAAHGLAERASSEYRLLLKGKVPGGIPLLCIAGVAHVTATALINTAAVEGAHKRRYAVTAKTGQRQISVWPFGMEIKDLETPDRLGQTGSMIPTLDSEAKKPLKKE